MLPVARMFGGSVMPLRKVSFSCRSLMPETTSASKAHMVTS